MSRGVRLLVVRPHPDDEASATGGLLARYAAQGVTTGLITCTNGEEGEVLDPDLDVEEAKPRLGEIRIGELRRACDVLGVSELRLLGYRDSGMAGWAANAHPEAFCNADLDEAAGRVVRVIRELQPQVVVTENNNGSYSHPDHVMCHHVSVRAFEAAGDPEAYPDAGPPWNPARLYAVCGVRGGWAKLGRMLREAGYDESFIGRRRRYRRRRAIAKKDTHAQIDVADYAEIQREALACHRSQITEDSWWLGMPSHIRRVAFGTCYFLRLHPAPDAGERQHDLFHDLD